MVSARSVSVVVEIVALLNRAMNTPASEMIGCLVMFDGEGGMRRLIAGTGQVLIRVDRQKVRVAALNLPLRAGGNDVGGQNSGQN
jgi:hypothetical protein